MTEQTDEDGHENRSSRFNLVSMETLTSLHQICANVIGYCRTVVNSAGALREGGSFPFFFPDVISAVQQKVPYGSYTQENPEQSANDD